MYALILKSQIWRDTKTIVQFKNRFANFRRKQIYLTHFNFEVTDFLALNSKRNRQKCVACRKSQKSAKSLHPTVQGTEGIVDTPLNEQTERE